VVTRTELSWIQGWDIRFVTGGRWLARRLWILHGGLIRTIKRGWRTCLGAARWKTSVQEFLLWEGEKGEKCIKTLQRTVWDDVRGEGFVWKDAIA